MGNQPSLLDEGDFAAIGGGRKSSGPMGPGRDNAKMMKIVAVVVLFALAGLAGTYSIWKPEGPVKNSRGETVQAREVTPEDEEAILRQEREQKLLLEQGATIGAD